MSTFELTEKQVALRDMAAGLARNVLAYGGSRSGKTFLFVYAVCVRALMAPGSRHVIFRKTGVSVKQSIGKDTLPKVLELAFPGLPTRWHEQDGYMSLPEGSEIWLAGLEDKERVDKVLGREFATLYFNEASEIPVSAYVTAQTRLAQVVKKRDGRILALRTYVDLNPTTRTHWTYRMWIDGINPEGETPVDLDDYAHMVLNPRDNLANLSADYLKALSEMPERARRRFYLGEYSSDVEESLWRREYIKRVQAVPDLRRVVVAIDPAISNNPGSDETGLVCVGVGIDGMGYVLADESGRYRPEEWAARARSLFHSFQADRIVAEGNVGGHLVETVLRAQGINLPYKQVTARRGKVMRAEPVAALYERGRVFHVGVFDKLEDQMCSFTSDFDRKEQGYSPDRVDALVWGFTELFGKITKKANLFKDGQRHQPKPRLFA